MSCVALSAISRFARVLGSVQQPKEPMSEPYHFVEDAALALDAIPTDSIVSRTLLRDGEFKALLFGFATGQELSEHTAARPAVLHFLEGEAELTLGEDKRSVKAGAWVHMQAHLPHSIQALTPVKMLLLLLPSE